MFAKKNHVFMLCWTTYVITYLCRVNFSSAMEKLSLGTGIDLAKLGVIGSVFFFSYALGQLVNGFLGDRTPPFVFISAAITATGFLNLLMSQTVSSLGLTCIWGLNGYIQSMLWGPMMRILSERFEPHERIKVSTRMSSSMVAGFILSWAVFGKAFASFLELVLSGPGRGCPGYGHVLDCESHPCRFPEDSSSAFAAKEGRRLQILSFRGRTSLVFFRVPGETNLGYSSCLLLSGRH